MDMPRDDEDARERRTLNTSSSSNLVCWLHHRMGAPSMSRCSLVVHSVHTLYFTNLAVVVLPTSSAAPHTLQLLLRLRYCRAIINRCCSRRARRLACNNCYVRQGDNKPLDPEGCMVWLAVVSLLRSLRGFAASLWSPHRMAAINRYDCRRRCGTRRERGRSSAARSTMRG